MKLSGQRISLGSIPGIVQEAGKRAQQWLSQQQASTPRALALDEQYSSQRGKMSLLFVADKSGPRCLPWQWMGKVGRWSGGIWVSRDCCVSAVSVMEETP